MIYWNVIQQIPFDSIFFLDEIGSNRAMTRAYARSPKGERAYSFETTNKGKNITVIGVLGIKGIVAWRDWEGAMNYDRLMSFLRAQACDETIPRGSTLVMDNHRAHRKEEVAQELARHGIRVVYLPPYHPELNPIEYFWSRVKAYLRKCKARTTLALRVAIDDAFEKFGTESALSLFNACGYAVES